MVTVKETLAIFGRLPLLFVIDSVLKGTFLDLVAKLVKLSLEFLIQYRVPNDLRLFNSQYIYVEQVLSEDDVVETSSSYDLLLMTFWITFTGTVTLSSLILVCSPLEILMEVYGCLLGLGLLGFSYRCNQHFVLRTSGVISQELVGEDVIAAEGSSLLGEPVQEVHLSSLFINMLTNLVIALTMKHICIVGTLQKNSFWASLTRLPLDFFLFLSFTLPVFSYCLQELGQFWHNISPLLALIFPSLLLLFHSAGIALSVGALLYHEVKHIRNNVQEVGFDGLLLQLMDKTNLSWLLRTFFLTKVAYLVSVSVDTSELSSMNATDLLHAGKELLFEVLQSMCGTILSVMGMASIISVISEFCLNIVYRIIGAQDEEESFQPAVSGFLFVLLAMQTGMTSMVDESRLQLLFQNCILLVVANQHFVQAIAADMLLKASVDNTALIKHVRPLLPYVIFFSFPFIVILRLWEYPFRISWLLAISAFSLELIIKSVGTLVYYSLNLLQPHISFLHEHMEDITFYIKAVCGCLEFTCGIFLFFNGAYIFFFESGGLIRFVMMVIHFYCNIYQTAVKGLKTFQLRRLAWRKMSKLRPASQEQLDEYNDICPICYQDMTEAVVVKCSHVFHRNCLQKWFTIQEKCPLCHVDLSEDNSLSAKNK